MPNEDATLKGWLSIVDQLAPLKPRFIVPDHGELGDGSLIAKERAILLELQARALELKQKGTSVEDAGRALTAEFLAKYPANLDGPSFVDALLATIMSDIGVDLTAQRSGLIDLFNSGGRGEVLYRLADDNVQTNPINNRALIDAEYNRAFVFTQYAGYLRRDADIGGFLFWLDQVDRAPLRDVGIQHTMVCAFITSTEYQLRFSPVVTHHNSDCQ